MSGGWSRERMEAATAHFERDEARLLRLVWEDAERRRRARRSGAPAHVGAAVASIMTRLGIPPPATMEELSDRWSDLAGPQWGSHAVPVVVRHGQLLVEAGDRRIVRSLRHDADRLVERLAGHFGPAFITGVKVVSPPGRRGW